MNERNHISIREAIRGRITDGEWAPGAMMPGETDLAEEYGCSRTTVNRALQKLAEDGLIERKRSGEEKGALAGGEAEAHRAALDGLQARLAREFESSQLPEEVTSFDQLDDFVVRARLELGRG